MNADLVGWVARRGDELDFVMLEDVVAVNQYRHVDGWQGYALTLNKSPMATHAIARIDIPVDVQASVMTALVHLGAMDRVDMPKYYIAGFGIRWDEVGFAVSLV